ncbi:MAG TPA: peptidase M64 N-terminal domain-containing protein [Ignavibacteriales bacterium]|nr:peptidase M64 N-terminal domain-containing protein [Ignavibacteriales bacterium]
MKKTFFLFLAFVTASFAQTDFDAYFVNKTLRLDYFHTGDDSSDSYSFDRMMEEPYWGGTKKNLIDPFQYGSYRVMVYDSASGKLIYSRGYSTLFSEWQTTDEAKKTHKTFSETVTFPFPKKTVRVELNTWTRSRKMV